MSDQTDTKWSNSFASAPNFVQNIPNTGGETAHDSTNKRNDFLADYDDLLNGSITDPWLDSIRLFLQESARARAECEARSEEQLLEIKEQILGDKLLDKNVPFSDEVNSTTENTTQVAALNNRIAGLSCSVESLIIRVDALEAADKVRTEQLKLLNQIICQQE